MGFLLFAARKLQLKRQINQLSYRNIELSQEQQIVSQKLKDLQLAQQKAQNTINIFATAANSAQQMAAGAQALAGGQNAQLSYMLAANQTSPATYAANVMNSIFTAANATELARLNAKDSEISLELENNESQLELLQNEYQSVKKAESNEAQNSAPTFGLA